MLYEGIEDIQYIKTWKDLKNWIVDNNESLENLIGYEGFDQILGSGESGRAWKIKGRELVLKLTTDPDEIEFGKKLEGKDYPSFLKVYKCISVKGTDKYGEKIDAQLRIQELCYPVDWGSLTGIGQYELLGWIQSYIDQIYEGYKQEVGRTQVDEQFLDYFLETIKQDPDYEDVEYSSTDRIMILKCLKFGVQLLQDVSKVTGSKDLHQVDLHDENVMEDKNGNFKMIDF